MSDLDTDMAGIPYAKQQAIIQVAQACASLSFLGSAVVVVAYFRFKQLVSWLAVCDIAVNLSFFLGSPSDGSGLCYFQGFLQRFFQVALIQWTILIAQSLLVVSSTTRAFDADKRMPWNHLWAWGVSVLLSGAPLSTGSFGKTESFFCCVYSGDSWNVGYMWRAFFLVMVFASMVAIVWAYAKVVKNLSHSQKIVVRLSLSATTSRYRETLSENQQQRSPGNAPEEASLTSLKTISHLKINREDLLLPVSSLGEPPTTRGIFGSEQHASSEPGNGVAAPKKRASRRDSLWRRVVLGSVMEGSESSASPDCLRREGSVKNSRQSSASSISYSNVSVKNWLWSASRDVFLDDDESLGQSSEEKEEECKNALWLDGMASPSRRRLSSSLKLRENPAPTATAPERVPTLKETRQGRSSVDVGAVIVPEVLMKSDDVVCESSRSSTTMNWKNILPTERATTQVKAAVSTTALEPLPLPLPLPAVEHATAASFHGHGSGGVSTPVSSLAPGRVGSHIEDPLVAAAAAACMERSKSNPVGTTIATLQKPIKSRVVNRVDRARGYVSRMSSLDMDHGSVGYGNGVVVRGGWHGPADKGARSVGGQMPPGQNVSGATITPMGEHEQHLPTKRAPEKDMDRFISRIKWYPVIYVLTWTAPLINEIYTIAVGQSKASFSLVLLATITTRLQGLLNFICYGLNDKLKQTWLQDLMCRRAAVASCCCAPWCCCFGPCHRHEDGNDDGGDVDADRTRVTDDAAQGSSGLNSFADVNLADEMEKGANMTVASFPPLVGETPPRAPRKSIAALYATPFHSVRQGRSSLAPARPARPGRKACAARHPSRRSAAAGSGCRGKRTAKLTARDPAAGVRRQRALVGRVRAKRRRDKPVVESSVPADDDIPGGGIPGSGTRKKTHKPDGSRKKRRNHRGSRKRSTGGVAAAACAAVVLSPALPITISIPVLPTAAAVSGRRTAGPAGPAGRTSRRSRQKNGRYGTGIRYLGGDETFSSSSDGNEELDRRVKTPSRRDARRSRPSRVL